MDSASNIECIAALQDPSQMDDALYQLLVRSTPRETRSQLIEDGFLQPLAQIITSPSSTNEHMCFAIEIVRNVLYASSSDLVERFADSVRQTVTLGITQKIIDILNQGGPDEDKDQEEAAIFMANTTVMHVIGHELVEQGALQALAPKLSHDSMVGMLCMMSVANLVGKEEGERGKLLSANPNVAKRLLVVLAQAMGNATVYGMCWSVEELLHPLSNMVISDDNKPHFCNQETADLLLSVASRNDSSSEAIGLALSALLQLCFEPTGTVKNLLRDPERAVLPLLERIHNSDVMNELTLEAKDSVSRLKWTLAEQVTQDAAKADSTSASSAARNSKKRVFMSYNWKHQPLIKRVVTIVKQAGFDVWFDLEQMQGSTMEAMAEGIDNSDLILMTISPQYKDSANCRLEGQYAMQQKKPIIPLMMVEGYSPKGWLGLLLGSKLWYDLTQDNKLESTMPAVLSAMHSSLNTQPSSDPITTTTTTTTATLPESVHEQMSAHEIEQWLAKGELGSYATKFRELDMDGKALAELNIFLQRDSIGEVKQLQDLFAFASLGDALRFSRHLATHFGRK